MSADHSGEKTILVGENPLVTRDEFKSEIGRVEAVLATQIGAVEKTLRAKLGNLKAWGVTALVGGQALAGFIAALMPHAATQAALHIIHALS